MKHEKSSSYVKNWSYFVELIQGAFIYNNQTVSLDVVSLFAKASTDVSLLVV